MESWPTRDQTTLSQKSHLKTLAILIPTFKLYMGVFLLKEEEIMI